MVGNSARQYATSQCRDREGDIPDTKLYIRNEGPYIRNEGPLKGQAYKLRDPLPSGC